MNNPKDVIESFVHDKKMSKSIFGLERVKYLLKLLDNPQDKIKYVHIVGTNGKGSTCAIMQSVFASSGYKTGMFTSPPLVLLNEQIKIDGQDIKDVAFAKVIEEVNFACDKMEEQGIERATFFERITACAFKAFCDEKVDIAFVEAGLGGRLDSTNEGTPLMVMITSISLDHTDILGNTIEKIAEEKSAVIRTNSKVVLAKQDYSDVITLVKAKCKEENAQMLSADGARINNVEINLTNTKFTLQTEKETYNMTLNLLGKHQVDNAVSCIMACESLKDEFDKITKETIIDGTTNAMWRGRIQKLDERVIFDGAHNAKSAKVLADTICDMLNEQKIILLTGCVEDKDVKKISSEFARFAHSVIVTEPNTIRGVYDGDDLFRIYKNKISECILLKDVKEALYFAKEFIENNKEYMLVIAGSLYMAHDVNEFWEFE